MIDKRFNKRSLDLPGFIAVPGRSRYRHYFGGRAWETVGCAEGPIQPTQLLTLDLKDPRLSAINASNIDELPLVSYVNLLRVPDRQIFRLGHKNRRIECLYRSKTSLEPLPEDYQFPNPLPKKPLLLRQMRREEQPRDEESYRAAEDTLFGDSLIRILGTPLYLQEYVDIKCRSCRRLMTYVASIGYEIYGRPGKLLASKEPYFPGEFVTYFLVCLNCLVTATVCQST